MVTIPIVSLFLKNFMIKPPSLEAQVSTSVDFASTVSSSTIQDDAYVNPLYHDDAPGTIATSCSQSFYHPPSFILMRAS